MQHQGDFIAKGTNVAVVVQCGGLWFANGKFGVTWRLVQAMVKPRAGLFGKCHVMLTEEDRARLENQDSGEDEQVTTTNVEDSDEESEEDHHEQARLEAEAHVKELAAAASATKAPKKVKRVVKKA